MQSVCVLWWLIICIRSQIAFEFSNQESQPCKPMELTGICKELVSRLPQQQVPLEFEKLCKPQPLCGNANIDLKLQELCSQKQTFQFRTWRSLKNKLEFHSCGSCWGQCNTSKYNEDVSKLQCCMDVFNKKLENGRRDDVIHSIEDLEYFLEETKVNETTSISVNNIVAALYKPTGESKRLEIHANDKEAELNMEVSKRTVTACLPEQLNAGENNTVVFCVIHLPNKTEWNGSELYDGKLYGLSVRGKNTSRLEERVNITIPIATNITKTNEPLCVFLDTLNDDLRSNGCQTLWERNQTHVTCSCNHLTYFGVLMVSVPLSSVDQQILSYITIIGCSISLFSLVITVLIFISNRKLKVDDSKKIHVSLSVALILLNIHFLPSEAVAAMYNTGFCLYMALGLHYSLLATFSWMALEGLHLYLLLVKVFNIYIRRYLLKLSVVGWGVPAVIVSVVVIVDTDYYGRAPLDVSKPNGSAICYLTSDTGTNIIVKMVTTVGVFSLVFLFNVIMFGVTVRWFVSAHFNKEVGQSVRSAAKREICTVLAIMVLLGITWGFIFFIYGNLATPGLYIFSILNSLQGFFIFIYFALSLKKTKESSDNQSTETRTTSTRT